MGDVMAAPNCPTATKAVCYAVSMNITLLLDTNDSMYHFRAATLARSDFISVLCAEHISLCNTNNVVVYDMVVPQYCLRLRVAELRLHGVLVCAMIPVTTPVEPHGKARLSRFWV